MPNWLVDSLDWMELSPGLAAWFQAFSGGIGIAVAIYLPWRIHSNERTASDQDRLQQAQALSILIAPSVRDLRCQLERALRADRLWETEVAVPESLIRNSAQLWLMGKAGGNLLSLIGHLIALENLNKEDERIFGKGRPIRR